ncbi:type I-F CRISPR-associated helicase Cas3f [Avibacterium sp. 20-15]|uniref:type I-F CRISPR-associated helicase Cas3f n=1 Tax=unclassified Avibacterium TaxID=2685287 RepID=UPI002025D874|nr:MULTISPECIES: type I-F CRISPR-associated helicase Cas3f [unclassified Avibacterium]MCW9733019.1 type I-F CRISPR-associated helicase Cas3f [Avibacterium sp. 20-15]URL05149.1 type I-F CRISPR-associated helicase Cas3f [Avibacterium sp. 20-132]
MIVTFVSQCEKKALKRTRRILDSFANRIGDNVWQTAITQEGLNTVAALLRQSATKSTAVSCHRNRTSHTTELLFIIGNRRKFNELGIVPVNYTKRNIMHQEWENDWQYLTAMQIIATLAALLHDIGKSNLGFQQKLKGQTATKGEPYRHEWVSLKLFLWLVADCQTDEAVFDRLIHLDHYLANHKPAFETSDYGYANMQNLPPLAQWIGWLIVTHHRLPPLPRLQDTDASDDGYTTNAIKEMQQAGNRYYNVSAQDFYKSLRAINHWVHNPQITANLKQNWQFEYLVLHSKTLQKQLKRFAQKAKNDSKLTALSQPKSPISNPLLLNLSRLILMTGDHNYSSQPKDSKQRVSGDTDWQDKLIANTDRKTKETKQALDEHLLGVADYCGRVAKALPIIQAALPKLKDHDSLAKNTATARFQWQNQAFKLAREVSGQSQTHGFFAINMASTGCGKTIANARIAYALADTHQGARFTIALGLRTLTLQTGASLRQDLGLSEKELAVLVGGRANKQLFELNQKTEEDSEENGSLSAESLIDSYVDSRFEPSDFDVLGLGVLTQQEKAQLLLYSPIVSCTIDHLMQASEQLRGGHYIIPTLRLLSSDLILDEPDDFSESDLPALTRLVHLAGLYGSRIILSSATLQPDQVYGLFTAYLEGRKIYNENFNLPAPSIPCLWSDENHSSISTCTDTRQHSQAHQRFLEKRQRCLKQQPIQRIGEILPMVAKVSKNPKRFYPAIAKQLLEYATDYHHRHHFDENGKTISIGLIRMANITPMMQTALALYAQDSLAKDTHIHLAVYHSRQALILRNQLEQQLDAILNRKNGNNPANHPAIKTAIAAYPNAKHHLFIVLASPVCEVGRDHDYDWAIAEPSSMRSLIQLAGRINRHRPYRQPKMPNLGIWQHNIRGIKQENCAFIHPGYESAEYRLNSHNCETLIPAEQLKRIDAQPRIIKPAEPDPKNRLSDLEHQVLAELMQNDKINIVNAYWQPELLNRHHCHLIRLSPFRQGEKEADYLIRPEDSGNVPYHLEQIEAHGFSGAKTAQDVIKPYPFENNNEGITPWLTASLKTQISQLSEKLGISDNTAVIRFAGITLPERQHTWYFHEYFGCWENE